MFWKKKKHKQPQRTIYFNDREMNRSGVHYCSNKISTTKYNIITFIPRFLFDQFRRYANLFFLVIALLQVRWTKWMCGLNVYRFNHTLNFQYNFEYSPHCYCFHCWCFYFHIHHLLLFTILVTRKSMLVYFDSIVVMSFFTILANTWHITYWSFYHHRPPHTGTAGYSCKGNHWRSGKIHLSTLV